MVETAGSREASFGQRGERRGILRTALVRIVEGDGPDRYVLSYALEALRRLADDGDGEARQSYLDALEVARWCPRTTAESAY